MIPETSLLVEESELWSLRNRRFRWNKKSPCPALAPWSVPKLLLWRFFKAYFIGVARWWTVICVSLCFSLCRSVSNSSCFSWWTVIRRHQRLKIKTPSPLAIPHSAPALWDAASAISSGLKVERSMPALWSVAKILLRIFFKATSPGLEVYLLLFRINPIPHLPAPVGFNFLILVLHFQL
jgi:hypothetical protein